MRLRMDENFCKFCAERNNFNVMSEDIENTFLELTFPERVGSKNRKYSDFTQKNAISMISTCQKPRHFIEKFTRKSILL